MRRAREIRIGAGPPGPPLRYDLSWIWRAAALWLGIALAISAVSALPW